jgi:lactate dehydrogenase-like 2-hydroxyacid dehydrogenase
MFYFINTSRPEIVDTNVIIETIYEKCLKVEIEAYESETSEGIAKFEQSEFADLVYSAACHIDVSILQGMERIRSETINMLTNFVKAYE